MFIIYKATHIPTGKVYVGQTQESLEVRMGQHWGTVHKTSKFLDFLHKTKMDEWKWEILHTVKTRQEARECEMYYITTLRLYEEGLNSITGYSKDSSTALKASERFKQYKKDNPEPWNKGKKGCFSEETLELMRLSKLQKPSRPVYTEQDKINKSLQATNSKKIKELKTQLEFNSISRAAKHFNLRREAVRDVVNGKRTHTAGYVFVEII